MRTTEQIGSRLAPRVTLDRTGNRRARDALVVDAGAGRWMVGQADPDGALRGFWDGVFKTRARR
jgi:hypothetical protein